AALPVGADNAIRSGGRPAAAACSAINASSRATVVVLPVPGPPVSTVSPCDKATSAAARCSSYPAGKSRSEAGAVPGGRAVTSVSTSSQTCCSSRQYRSRYTSRPSTRSADAVTSGLAATASSHADGDGHGSSGLPICPATADRSTHTDPPRNARTTNATASATRSSGSPPSSHNRRATCTSAVSITPASANSRSSPSAPTGNRHDSAAISVGAVLRPYYRPPAEAAAASPARPVG